MTPDTTLTPSKTPLTSYPQTSQVFGLLRKDGTVCTIDCREVLDFLLGTSDRTVSGQNGESPTKES